MLCNGDSLCRSADLCEELKTISNFRQDQCVKLAKRATKMQNNHPWAANPSRKTGLFLAARSPSPNTPVTSSVFFLNFSINKQPRFCVAAVDVHDHLMFSPLRRQRAQSIVFSQEFCQQHFAGLQIAISGDDWERLLCYEMCWLWTKRRFWVEKNDLVVHHCLTTLNMCGQRKSWRKTKGVRRRERNWKKKTKRQKSLCHFATSFVEPTAYRYMRMAVSWSALTIGLGNIGNRQFPQWPTLSSLSPPPPPPRCTASTNVRFYGKPKLSDYG